MTAPTLRHLWLSSDPNQMALRADFSDNYHIATVIDPPYGPDQLAQALLRMAAGVSHIGTPRRTTAWRQRFSHLQYASKYSLHPEEDAALASRVREVVGAEPDSVVGRNEAAHVHAVLVDGEAVYVPY